MTVWQHRRARRLVRRSEPVDEPWLAGLFADLRARLRVAEGSVLRLSPDVATPQVLGLMRPVVLLPASAPMRLSRPELAMTLCHELIHVRRGDLWLAWLPALAQRLFFFHPLALLAAREYLLAREGACDAEVLRVLTPAPETYGRLLVRLGVTPGVPRLAAAGAAPSFRILKRRLQMLQNASQTARLHPAWWGLVALAAVVALIPFTITAQAASSAPAATAALPVPAAAPQSALPVTPAAQHQKRALPPAPPVPPVPPRPPVPPVPPRTGFWMGSNHEESYVLLSGKNTFINGSWWDKAKARTLRKSDDEDIFWFERGGKEYVIRDAAALRQIKALFDPQAELGKRQGALGEQQAKLGLQQAKLGSQQAEQGGKQAEIGAQIGRLGAELARLAQERKSTDAVEAQMRELEAKQDAAARPQEDLSRQQEQLGRQQEELGHQQEELGRQQEKLAREAEKQLASLTANAISSGTAHELK
jgi:bla regulator protein BlaR1